MDSVYYQFALLLMLSALVGAMAVRLREPLLVAYWPKVLVALQSCQN